MIRTKRAMDKVKVGTAAVGALAVGAVAFGAMAIGALVVGAMTIRRMRVLEAQIDKLSIGTLTVDHLDVPLPVHSPYGLAPRNALFFVHRGEIKRGWSPGKKRPRHAPVERVVKAG